MARDKTRVAIGVAAVCALAVGATAPATADSSKVYTIYLSNNFNGNDWRQQMLHSAQVAATKAPLAGRVKLTIDNVETTTQAQINSLNNIIREKPDAILVDAGSGDALNPTLERACKTGIVVVSFDQVVTADCAYKVTSNFDTMAANQALWVATLLKGKGKVLVDRGLAGAPVSERLENGFKSVLDKYPGIEIVRVLQRQLCARPGTGGRRQPARRQPRGRWHPLSGLRHRRHHRVAGCRPQTGTDHRRRLQRHCRHLPEKLGAVHSWP